MTYDDRDDYLTSDERAADRLTERPSERAARVARKPVDDETARVVRRALGLTAHYV